LSELSAPLLCDSSVKNIIFLQPWMNNINPFETKTTPMAIASISVATLLLLAPMAFAQSPHFVKGPTDPDKSGLNTDTVTISTSFKAAGLGNDPVDVFMSADSVDLSTECENKGGNNPPGQDVTIEDLTGPVKTITPRNGQITASPTLSVTVTAEQADCPDSMQPLITSANFENVMLVIQDEDGNTILSHDFGDVDP
jgi:hypothetical protein